MNKGKIKREKRSKKEHAKKETNERMYKQKKEARNVERKKGVCTKGK